jgi:hypothetical protein
MKKTIADPCCVWCGCQSVSVYCSARCEKESEQDEARSNPPNQIEKLEINQCWFGWQIKVKKEIV